MPLPGFAYIINDKKSGRNMTVKCMSIYRASLARIKSKVMVLSADEGLVAQFSGWRTLFFTYYALEINVSVYVFVFLRTV